MLDGVDLGGTPERLNEESNDCESACAHQPVISRHRTNSCDALRKNSTLDLARYLEMGSAAWFSLTALMTWPFQLRNNAMNRSQGLSLKYWWEDSVVRVRAVAAVAFLALMVTGASACSCEESTWQERFAGADLVVKGRVKTVTYGIDLESDLDLPRWARAEIEIEKVLKGTFTEKTISTYTGFGMGDCGILGPLLHMALYYKEKEMGVLELGMNKGEFGEQVVYVSSICGYIKGPKDIEE